MENKEGILNALEGFNNTADIDIKEIPEILEKLIVDVAKTGETVFPWQKLKSLFMFKIDTAMKNFQESISMDKLSPIPNVENVKFDVMRKRILERLAEFSGAPFTIQRLAELVVDPKKHYKRTDKFLRAVEKNVMVVSTVDPYGNKIVSDTKLMMNGDMNGSLLDRNSSLFMPPAPMNSPATSAALSRADEGSPLPAWPQKAMDSAVSTSTSISQTTDTDSQPFNPVTVFPSQSTGACSSNTENKPSDESISASENLSQPSSEDDKENRNRSKGSSDSCTSAETEDGSSQGSDSSEKSDSSVSSLSSDENTPPSKEKAAPTEITQNSSGCSNDSDIDEQKSNENGQTLQNAANEQNTQMETDEKQESESAVTEDSIKSQKDENFDSKNVDVLKDNTNQETDAEVEDTPASKKRKSDQMSPIDTPPCKKLNTEDQAAPDQTAQEIDSRRESCGFETNPNCEENDSSIQSTEQPASMTTQLDDVTSSSDSQKPSTSENNKIDSSSSAFQIENVKSSEVRTIEETEGKETHMGMDVENQESNVDSSKPEDGTSAQSNDNTEINKSNDADSLQS